MKKILVVFLFVFGLFCVWQYTHTPSPLILGTTKNIQQEKYEVTQIIEGTSTRYTVLKGKTALFLLNQTASIQTKGKGTSAFVISINGRTAEEKNKEFWAFYVNGKPSPVGAGSYILQNNDIIKWTIERF